MYLVSAYQITQPNVLEVSSCHARYLYLYISLIPAIVDPYFLITR